MAETTPTNPFTNYISFAALQDPTKALQYQQQQLLAQQLMADGDKPTDPLRTAVGGVAIPISPLEYASKAVEKGLGAYQQMSNTKMLADMLRGPSSQDASVAAMNANGGGPTNQNAQLAAGLQGGPNTAQSFLPPGMDMQTAMRISMLPGEALQKAALDRYMMTNEQKNFQDPNTRNNALAGGFVKTDGGMVPAGDLAKTFQPPQGMNPMMGNLIKAESGGNPNAVSSAGAQGIAQIMPATAADPGYGVRPLQGMTNGNPATAPVPEQLRFSNDYLNAMQAHNGGDPRLAAASYNAGPGRVDQALASLPAETQAYVPKVAGPNVAQMNNPVYQAGAKANAEKSGQDLAEVQKAYDAAVAQIPAVKGRFNEMTKAAPNASFGYGVDNEGEGFKQQFHNQFDQILGRPEASANLAFKQKGSQGVLGEIGPQLAATGAKGNKFLESVISKASDVDANQSPETKIKGVQGLQSNYVSGVKSMAANLRSQGIQNVLSDEDIDAAFVPDEAVAHLKSNPSLASHFEQKYKVPSKRFLGQ